MMGTETPKASAQLAQLRNNFANKSPEGTAEIKTEDGDITLVSTHSLAWEILR